MESVRWYYFQIGPKHLLLSEFLGLFFDLLDVYLLLFFYHAHVRAWLPGIAIAVDLFHDYLADLSSRVFHRLVLL